MSSEKRFFYLTLVRHGETQSNKLHILQGQMDTLLSENGKEQARQLSSHLSSFNISFDLVFSSDLTRAIETAQMIVDNLQADNEPSSAQGDCVNSKSHSRTRDKCCSDKQDVFDSGHCSGTESDAAAALTLARNDAHRATDASSYAVQIDSRLRERSYGVLEGSTLKELHEAAKAAGLHEKSYTCLAPQGVESLEEVQKRIDDFLCNHLIHQVTLCTDSPPHNQVASESASLGEVSDSRMQSANLKPLSVLVVTHGGVIREFMRLFRDKYNCLLDELEEPIQVTPNTGVNIFKVVLEKKGDNESDDITAVQLLIYNDLNHLKEKPDDMADRCTIDQSSANLDKILSLVNALKMKLVKVSQVNPVVQPSQYEAL